MSDSLISVGIDLGTSTTQMVLSKLTIKNMASGFTIPRVEITDKEVIYESDIIFTPLLNEQIIDVEKIKQFLDQEYQRSGYQRKDIQVGAVIITGETARKDNASKVLEAMSGYAGDFVVATAGPDLESIIAGKGAGAQIYSKENHTVVVNLDIGGGTTNLSVFNDNDLTSTACFDVGGRVIKIDPETMKVIAITPKIQKIIEKEKLPINIGKKVATEDLVKIADILANVLENMVGTGEASPYYSLLVTNKMLKDNLGIKCVSFSGGVADCVFNDSYTSPLIFGDIGILLGKAIRKSKIMSEFKVVHSEETIRATVVGAGSHTTMVSGSTITYQENILPIQNIPVLKIQTKEESEFTHSLSETILEKTKWYHFEDGNQLTALGLTGTPNPTFKQIEHLAEQIIEGTKELVHFEQPLIIVVANDNAKSLGQALFNRLPKEYPLICIDNVYVEDGDYIDIGLPIVKGSVLPVVVKTLVFE